MGVGFFGVVGPRGRKGAVGRTANEAWGRQGLKKEGTEGSGVRKGTGQRARDCEGTLQQCTCHTFGALSCTFGNCARKEGLVQTSAYIAIPANPSTHGISTIPSTPT